MTIAKFENIPDMKRTVTDSGSHFFTPGAIAFFNSQVVHFESRNAGTFFVTSEFPDDPADKKYTARYFTEPEVEGGKYEDHTIGEFHTYDSAAEARVAIYEFEANQKRAAEVLDLLRTFDVTAGTDDKGYPIFRLKDGRTIRGEAFGRGTVESRSGVRLHEAVERPEGYENVTEIVRGDFSRPRDFGEYVRGYIIRMIERAAN